MSVVSIVSIDSTLSTPELSINQVEWRLKIRELSAKFYFFELWIVKAMVVKKIGASKIHAIMAAGLAGGIGFGGGACGALGTAIWIDSLIT